MPDPLLNVVMSPDLLANLNAIAPTVKRRIMRPAFRKGAAVVAKAAKRKAPKRYGYLKKSDRRTTPTWSNLAPGTPRRIHS